MTIKEWELEGITLEDYRKMGLELMNATKDLEKEREKVKELESINKELISYRDKFRALQEEYQNIFIKNLELSKEIGKLKTEKELLKDILLEGVRDIREE